MHRQVQPLERRRTQRALGIGLGQPLRADDLAIVHVRLLLHLPFRIPNPESRNPILTHPAAPPPVPCAPRARQDTAWPRPPSPARSEKSRVGKRCVCACRSRGWTYHITQTKNKRK